MLAARPSVGVFFKFNGIENYVDFCWVGNWFHTNSAVQKINDPTKDLEYRYYWFSI
ncbi:MAG: hypothetical protein ACP5KW_11365 [Thermoproteota archaeon]